MNHQDARQPIYRRYADFLDADPRRRGDALELGTDWLDGDLRYRVCWYENTTELTIEQLSPDEPLDLDDFHRGIQGPIEIIAHIPTREDLSQLLGEWPNIAPDQTHTLTRLRALINQDPTAQHHPNTK
jgi:hypothetical protein